MFWVYNVKKLQKSIKIPSKDRNLSATMTDTTIKQQFDTLSAILAAILIFVGFYLVVIPAFSSSIDSEFESYESTSEYGNINNTGEGNSGITLEQQHVKTSYVSYGDLLLLFLIIGIILTLVIYS